MIMKTLSQKILYSMFWGIMALIFAFNGGYTGPSKDAPIEAKNPDEAKAVIACIADPQISNYMFKRYPIFKAAAEDLHNAKCDFDAVIGIGDIAENGLAMEYQLVYDCLSGMDTRYIMASGNHDLRLRLYPQSRYTFTNFVNALNKDESVDSLYYSEVINGYKVIVLGSEKSVFEEAYISDEQLDWLDEELKAEDGNPTFVLLHQPLKKTHNVENAWNSPDDKSGTVGDQSVALKAIMSKYENVFLVTGHLHSGFGPDSYNNVNGIHAINVPSTTVENKDGTYNGFGLGYIIEVYEDEVIFRARDMAKGTWVAETENDASYDIVVPVK